LQDCDPFSVLIRYDLRMLIQAQIMPKLNHVIFRADDSEIERLLRLAKIYGNKSATVRRALDLLEEQVTEQSKALAA